MNVTIRPSRARGTVIAPPSKSVAHRMLICAGLSDGESVVRNLALSDDIRATIACLRALGADIRLEGDTAVVRGVDPREHVGRTLTLPCNESGSTLRLFIPLCELCGEERVLSGTEYLLSRPLAPYVKIAEESGIRFEQAVDRLTVQGHLSPDTYEIPGNISSQFVTGMMLALPLLSGDSELRINTPLESMSYIRMTIEALRTFGVSVKSEVDEEKNQVVYHIPGGSRYIPADVTVEGDHSNAAFFYALNCAGSDITVEGLRDDSLQGDRICRTLFGVLRDHGGEISLADCPDLGPVLFAAAALYGGGMFTDTKRLRFKESDRAEAMRQELTKFGAAVTVEENRVIIRADRLHAPTEPLCAHGDHRIVMALSVLATVTGGVIEGAEHVNKSFPDFFNRLKELGVDIEYGMDQ